MFKTMMRIEMIEMSEMITWKEEQVRTFFKSTNYSANNISKQLILKNGDFYSNCRGQPAIVPSVTELLIIDKSETNENLPGNQQLLINTLSIFCQYSDI